MLPLDCPGIKDLLPFILHFCSIFHLVSPFCTCALSLSVSRARALSLALSFALSLSLSLSLSRARTHTLSLLLSLSSLHMYTHTHRERETRTHTQHTRNTHTHTHTHTRTDVAQMPDQVVVGGLGNVSLTWPPHAHMGPAGRRNVFKVREREGGREGGERERVSGEWHLHYSIV